MNTLSRFKNHDELMIHFRETSCFGGREDSIRIICRRNLLFATLCSANNKKQVALTEDQKQAFIRFENELHALGQRGGCTTRDYYTLRSRYGVFSKEDAGCQWEGYDFLKRALFGGPASE
jgi:hypothetical protein